MQEKTLYKNMQEGVWIVQQGNLVIRREWNAKYQAWMLAGSHTVSE